MTDPALPATMPHVRTEGREVLTNSRDVAACSASEHTDVLRDIETLEGTAQICVVTNNILRVVSGGPDRTPTVPGRLDPRST